MISSIEWGVPSYNIGEKPVFQYCSNCTKRICVVQNVRRNYNIVWHFRLDTNHYILFNTIWRIRKEKCSTYQWIAWFSFHLWSRRSLALKDGSLLVLFNGIVNNEKSSGAWAWKRRLETRTIKCNSFLEPFTICQDVSNSKQHSQIFSQGSRILHYKTWQNEDSIW